VSQKNNTDLTYYNFLVIFGRCVAEKVCCRMVSCYPTSPYSFFLRHWLFINIPVAKEDKILIKICLP